MKRTPGRGTPPRVPSVVTRPLANSHSYKLKEVPYLDTPTTGVPAMVMSVRHATEAPWFGPSIRKCPPPPTSLAAPGGSVHSIHCPLGGETYIHHLTREAPEHPNTDAPSCTIAPSSIPPHTTSFAHSTVRHSKDPNAPPVENALDLEEHDPERPRKITTTPTASHGPHSAPPSINILPTHATDKIASPPARHHPPHKVSPSKAAAPEYLPKSGRDSLH